MVDAAMIAPDNHIALPPSMEVAVAYPPYGLLKIINGLFS
jgi:hypothetical protein